MDSGLSVFQILLIVIIPAIISGIPAIISATSAKALAKKNVSMAPAESNDLHAGATGKISLAYDGLTDNLIARIGCLEARQSQTEAKVERQRRRIILLEQGIMKLIKQIQDAGGNPVFTLESITKLEDEE